MQHSRISWLVLSVGLAALAPVCAGQPAQPAGSGAPVALAYKFKQGRVTRQQVKTTGQLMMQIGGGSAVGASNQIPLPMNMDTVATQKVTAVEANGAATLTVTVESMKTTTNLLGQEMVIDAGPKGVTLNGQPMDASAMPAGTGTAIAQVVGRPFTMRLSPQGQLIEAETRSGAAPPASVPGLNTNQVVGGNGFLLLPDHPVRVGESWQARLPVQFPLGAGAATEMQMTATSTLKSINTQGGRRVATIETKGQLGPTQAAGSSGKPLQAYAATSLFDVDQGELLRSTAKVDLNVDLSSLGRGAPAAGPGPTPTPKTPPAPGTRPAPAPTPTTTAPATSPAAAEAAQGGPAAGLPAGSTLTGQLTVVTVTNPPAPAATAHPAPARPAAGRTTRRR